MKKSLFYLLFLSSFITKAQITITTNQLPYAGLGYITINDSAFVQPIPAGGANQTWNLSGQLGNDYLDTLGWVSASSTPYQSDFPSSNLASHEPNDSIYAYFTTNSSGFYINGFRSYGTGLPIDKLVFSPANLYIPTPFTYGSTLNSNYRFVVDIDTALPYYRLASSVAQTFNGDGYGSLQLPNASYPSTLRIKNVQTSYDTVYIDATGLGFYLPVFNQASQSTNFYWLRTAQPSLILEVSADSLGQLANSATYFEGTAVTSIADQPVATDQLPVVYPNPASDLVNISIPDPGVDPIRFILLDAQGRVVRETILEQVWQYGFYVNKLPAGIYTWNLSGGVSAYGRLVVTH